MNHITLPTVALLAAVIFSGCYTRFAQKDQTPPPPPAEQVEWVVDSATGDTVTVIKQVDTIRVEDNKTCVWERDLMGYPQLRCYDSFYPRDWFWYNNSPWWYRNDPYWHDYNRCPRYYYYDPSCGCCRYSGTSSYNRSRPSRRRDSYQDSDAPPARNGSTVPRGSSIYPRVHTVPDPHGTSPTKSSAKTSSATKAAIDSGRTSGTIIIEKQDNRPRSVNRRARSVPSSSRKAPATKSAPATKTSVAPSPQKSSTPPASTTPPPDSNKQAPPENKNSHSRNPRRW